MGTNLCHPNLAVHFVVDNNDYITSPKILLGPPIFLFFKEILSLQGKNEHQGFKSLVDFFSICSTTKGGF